MEDRQQRQFLDADRGAAYNDSNNLHNEIIDMDSIGSDVDDTANTIMNNNHDDTDNTVVLSPSSSRRMTMDVLLKKDASIYWKKLPYEHQIDKEFVLYVLKNSINLPPKSEFERKLPQSLRFDRDYVLAYAQRDDFRILYEQRRLFVPEHLKSDKEIMIAYCTKIPRSLQDCTEELANDKDVVKAAVKCSGLELQYASMNLREDEEIVRLACANHGCALEHCRIGGETHTKLIQDRTFLLNVVLSSTNDSGRMLQYAPIHMQHDIELVLVALTHGMQFRNCPIELQTSTEFLIKAVSLKSQLYLDMKRKDIQCIPEVAIAAIIANDSTHTVHKYALELCPQIRLNRNVALAIATRGEKSFIKEFLTNTTESTTTNTTNNGDEPNNNNNNDQNNITRNTSNNSNNNNTNNMYHRDFLADKEIMCQAIQHDCNLYAYCHNDLRNDPDILNAAITPDSADDVLRNVSATIQERFPEIAVKAIQVSNRYGLRSIRHMIPEVLWKTHRPLASAWIQRGCSIPTILERIIQNDRELALQVAQYCWHEFGKVVGIELRSDIHFMTEAVDQCGCVLRFAALPQIRNSLPLMVRAVACHPYALNTTNNGHASTAFLSQRHPIHTVSTETLLQYINDQLALHETFVVQFLRGIAIPSPPSVHPSNRSQLPMLDRGIETGQAFKKLIADFVGVPVGNELKMIRKAYMHLTNPPPHPPSTGSTVLDENHRDLNGNIIDDIGGEGGPMGGWRGRRFDDPRRVMMHRHRRMQQMMRMRRGIEGGNGGPGGNVAGGGGAGAGGGARPGGDNINNNNNNNNNIQNNINIHNDDDEFEDDDIIFPRLLPPPAGAIIRHEIMLERGLMLLDDELDEMDMMMDAVEEWENIMMME